ncbi:MAG: hypothetical protein ACJA08_002258 [Cyclobacteriaceae bacterium]|jgi:hypothetical protein
MQKSIVAFLLLFCLHAKGQKKENLHALEDVLQYYEREANVSFSFDPQIVRLITIDFDYTDKSLAEILELLRDRAPISIEQISEAYYTLALKESQFSIFFTDSIDSKKISDGQVILLVNKQTLTNSMISENGEFVFSYKPNPSHTLEVYAFGYKVQKLPFKALLNSKNLELKLSPSTVYLDDLVIQDYLTQGISLDPIDQKISIKVLDLPSLPGETDGDIFASLALLPGVSTPDNRPGNLFIRGSSTDQSLILYDNIPIYHRGHYYGTISPYNPKLVESVNVYRSGMHPRLGGRVGGAIEINSATDLVQESKYGFGLNSLYGTGYLKTPILKNKAGFAIGGRRSFPVTFSSPKLKAISDMVYAATAAESSEINPEASDFKVTYEDYNAKLEALIGDRAKLSVTGIYAGTFSGFTLDQDSVKDRLVSGFRNLGLNANLDIQLSEKLTSKSAATFSDYNVFFKQGRNGNIKSIEELKDFSASQEFEFGSKRSILYTSGFSVNYQKTDYTYQGVLINANQPPIRIGSKGITEAYSISPYFSMLLHTIDRLSLSLGMRGTYYSELQDFALLPRANFSIDVSERIMAKGSFGLYRQYLSQVKYLEFGGSGFDNDLWQLANDDIDIIHGYQSMAGFLVSKNKMVLDIEFYQKTANNVTYTESKRPEDGFVFQTADQISYGVDIFFKKKVSKQADVWTGYTFSHIFLTFDSLKSKQYHSKYDQPHVFYLGGSLSKRNFNFSGSWRFASGLYAQSPEILVAIQNYEQAIANRPNLPPINNPFEGYPNRFKSIHTLDLSASYKLPKTDKRAYLTTFGLSILNTYNQKNLTDQVTRAGEPSVFILDRNAIRFAPNLMVMVEW